MFSAKWTKRARQEYDRLQEAAASRSGGKGKKSKQQGLFKQVHKSIQLLLANPRHPSLQTHEYDSLVNPYAAGGKVFEAYAQNKTPGVYRVFWCYGPSQGEITILAITPHP